MGDALTAGEELILPPFGKAKVNRQKDLSSGEMLIVKLRRNDQQPAAPKRQDALAEAEE
jgi:DNA-binding protein HU-alpha